MANDPRTAWLNEPPELDAAFRGFTQSTAPAHERWRDAYLAAFGLGTDDKSIGTVDADGVALAAIQGLNQKLREELDRRDAENATLRQRLERLERLINPDNGNSNPVDRPARRHQHGP